MRVVGLVLFVLYVLGAWKVFQKAGQPGLFALIPGLNVVVLVTMAGKPWWWALLLLVPGLNLLVTVVLGQRIARSFGKGKVFGLGLVVLPMIFVPLLGLDESRYLGAQD